MSSTTGRSFILNRPKAIGSLLLLLLLMLRSERLRIKFDKFGISCLDGR